MSKSGQKLVAGVPSAGLLLAVAHQETRQTWVPRVLLLISVLELLLICLWKIVLRPRFFSPLRHVPTPEGSHWLLGHGMRLFQEPYCSPVRTWAQTLPNNGLFRYLGVFNAERIVVTSPEALHEVLVTQQYTFPKPASLRETAGRFLGLGLILSEGDVHRVQRRSMSPAFAPRNIRALYPLFWDKTRELAETVLRETRGRRDGNVMVEVVELSSRITLDLIGVAGLGRDFGAIRDKDNDLVQTYKVIFQSSQQARLLHFIESLVPAWVLNALPIQLNRDMAEAARSIQQVCREIIIAKKNKLSAKRLNDVDIISQAVKTGTFTDEGLLDQAMTLLAAGHDTTGSAFTWAIYLLARHPNVQRQLRREIHQRLPSLRCNQVRISSNDIDSMPFLQAVCSEVLRIYGPVPQTLREAACDTTLAGQFIPRGTRIVVAPWATNRDAKFWGSDANIFKPERWLFKSNANFGDELTMNVTGGVSTKYGFLSFLHGPRACIGQTFARAELACMLAGWVGSFEFSLRDEALMDESKLDIKGGLTARPAGGLYVCMKEVSGWA